jgi:hypothetical protein
MPLITRSRPRTSGRAEAFPERRVCMSNHWCLGEAPCHETFHLRIRGPINHGCVVRYDGGARAQRVRNFPFV